MFHSQTTLLAHTSHDAASGWNGNYKNDIIRSRFSLQGSGAAPFAAWPWPENCHTCSVQ